MHFYWYFVDKFFLSISMFLCNILDKMLIFFICNLFNFLFDPKFPHFLSKIVRHDIRLDIGNDLDMTSHITYDIVHDIRTDMEQDVSSSKDWSLMTQITGSQN